MFTICLLAWSLVCSDPVAIGEVEPDSNVKISVALDDTDTAMVAYAHNGNVDVTVQKAGKWSEPLCIASARKDIWYLQSWVDPSGDAIVLWKESEDIWTGKRNGQPWTNPTLCTKFEESKHLPIFLGNSRGVIFTACGEAIERSPYAPEEKRYVFGTNEYSLWSPEDLAFDSTGRFLFWKKKINEESVTFALSSRNEDGSWQVLREVEIREPDCWRINEMKLEVDQNGSIYVLCTSNGIGGYGQSLWVLQYRPASGWLDPMIVCASDDREIMNASLTLNAGGPPLIVYTTEDGLLYASYQTEGGLWSTPELLIPPNERAILASLGVAANGSVILIWEKLVWTSDGWRLGSICSKAFMGATGSWSESMELAGDECEFRGFKMNGKGKGVLVWLRGNIIEAMDIL